MQLLLGGDDEMPVQVAREIVRQGIADLDRGITPDKRWVAEARRAHADRIGRTEAAPVQAVWTWGWSQREYLDDLRRKGRSDRTVDDYAGILKNLSVFDPHLVGALTIDDFRRLLAAIAIERPSTAFRATEVARSVSRWLSASGRGDDFLADLKPPPGAARSTGKQERPPSTIDEIVEIVRRCRDGSMSPSVAGAIETVCLTGLRVRQVVGARPSDVREGVWHIAPGGKRGGFSLPLTPRLRTLLHASDEWLFPEVYTRDPSQIGPVTEAAVIIALRRIGATTATGIRTAIAGALADDGYSNDEIEGLHGRVSDDPIDEADATARRGQMLRTWGEVVEREIGFPTLLGEVPPILPTP
ncbi:hypothetical protein [Aureimonas glaciei]|uniref:hypothetical protein n=1 Tax=Aureimonas glaciei TaxID=1776957 RepID=UPI00166756BA|nr:hypothetical protein [Aureimonas glaciei]